MDLLCTTFSCISINICCSREEREGLFGSDSNYGVCVFVLIKEHVTRATVGLIDGFWGIAFGQQMEFYGTDASSLDAQKILV